MMSPKTLLVVPNLNTQFYDWGLHVQNKIFNKLE